MARLNEAPCSNESVDALKRRFIRQNRELAKHNSTQSIRIRWLESEVSRLLTENTGLREEILQLRNEVDGAPVKRALAGVKEQLQAQVQALADLVAGLGLEHKSSAASNGQFTRFPTVGWGRGLGDPLDGADGRLPAIQEHKSFPRRTLDAQEIQAVTDSESPTIGSPPISHFRDEEPIKFENQVAAEIKIEDEEEASLPANLETRRKKRDSTSKLAIRRMSVFSSPEDEAKATEDVKATTQVPPVRTSTKRKLSSREDDAKATEDFTFSRKTSGTSESEKESSAKEDQIKEPVKAVSKREAPRAMAPKLLERRALGEKNVNTDPVVSPKKTVKKSGVQQEKEAVKKISEATREQAKSRIRERRSKVTTDAPVVIPIPNESQDAPAVVEILPLGAKMDLPPKTPAALADVFSAPSTEDSSRPQTGRDTPPPGDLAASTDGNGRPGRRARAQVNYAEPSLAAKMRRPTKEMLDAVGKDGRPLHGILVKKGIEIKLEPEEGSAWKSMPSVTTDKPPKVDADRAEPGSPLSKKSTTTTETMKVKTEHPEPILPSAASQAIAALIRDSKKATAKRRSSALARLGGDSDTDTEKKDSASSSIYDFTSSSPPRSSLPGGASRPSSRNSDRSGDEKPRNSRRHSSIASLTAAKREAGMLEGSSKARFGTGSATAAAGHKRTVSGTAVSSSATLDASSTDLRASRRRSMML